MSKDSYHPLYSFYKNQSKEIYNDFFYNIELYRSLLNDFLDYYDEESITYIKSHINDIIEAVHQNENVAQLDYDEARQEFNMVFYFDGLFSKLDKKIYNLSQEMGIDFEPEEVWEISYDIENSEEYNDLITSAIKENSKTKGREI